MTVFRDQRRRRQTTKKEMSRHVHHVEVVDFCRQRVFFISWSVEVGERRGGEQRKKGGLGKRR